MLVNGLDSKAALVFMLAVTSTAFARSRTMLPEGSQLEQGILPSEWPEDEGACDKAPAFHVFEYNRMLTLCLKKFPGSYFVLIALSRGRFGP